MRFLVRLHDVVRHVYWRARKWRSYVVYRHEPDVFERARLLALASDEELLFVVDPRINESADLPGDAVVAWREPRARHRCSARPREDEASELELIIARSYVRAAVLLAIGGAP